MTDDFVHIHIRLHRDQWVSIMNQIRAGLSSRGPGKLTSLLCILNLHRYPGSAQPESSTPPPVYHYSSTELPVISELESPVIFSSPESPHDRGTSSHINAVLSSLAHTLQVIAPQKWTRGSSASIFTHFLPTSLSWMTRPLPPTSSYHRALIPLPQKTPDVIRRLYCLTSLYRVYIHC
jgi:hypothetical protein